MEHDVIIDGLHLPTIAKLARQLGSPTNDALAEKIWYLSNRPSVPGNIATEFLRAAGYVPFEGFPLRKAGL